MSSPTGNGAPEGIVRVTVDNSGGTNSPHSNEITVKSISSYLGDIVTVDNLPKINPDPRYCPPNGQPMLVTPEEWHQHSKSQKKKKLRLYYQKQGDILESYVKDRRTLGAAFSQATSNGAIEIVEGARIFDDKVAKVRKSDDWLAKGSMSLNLALVGAKLVSAILSGSMVVLGSLLDSVLDVTTGFALYITNKAIRQNDFYHYPRGRSRLEPLALLIVSVIMGALSVQMITRSFEEVVKREVELEIETPTIAIMGATVVLKFIAMTICYLYRSHQASVLALNHRNDTIANSFAIVCAYLADRYWVYLDPLTAAAIGIFLLISWLRCGYRYVQLLSGKTAKPVFINRILKICMDHEPELKHVDSVFAYYFGTKFLVEVVVSLDDDDGDERWTPAKKIYDINERLHKKLEALEEVERAFVTVERWPVYRCVSQTV